MCHHEQLMQRVSGLPRGLEFAVFVQIARYGALRPRDVAELLGVDRRRVWDALKRLEEKGVVERVARGVYVAKTGVWVHSKPTSSPPPPDSDTRRRRLESSR